MVGPELLVDDFVDLCWFGFRPEGEFFFEESLSFAPVGFPFASFAFFFVPAPACLSQEFFDKEDMVFLSFVISNVRSLVFAVILLKTFQHSSILLLYLIVKLSK